MATQRLTIKLFLSELKYDVQNKTYITGRSKANGNNFEQVANMQANEDEENNNQVLRSIQSAFGVLYNKLSEFCPVTNYTTTGAATDDELIDEDENDFEIVLQMPSNFNMTAKENIVTAAHQYVVNMAVAEWFNMTNKEDAANFVALANNNLNEIREALGRRVRPTRVVPNTL